MYQALLSSKLDSRVQCNICQWRCRILPGKTGVCRMYKNVGGILYNMNYGLVSSLAIDPIEKKPLYHYHPGSQVFSLGSWGCNFHCAGCQNWQISCTDIASPGNGSTEISPQKAVEMAINNDSAGIAWTYNEPTMWFEYTLESARLARGKGLYTVYVTNGYITPEGLDLIAPFLGAWRVDIKAFDEEYYRKWTRIANWRGILDVAERARHKWNLHVEVITNIVPGENDSDEQLRGIAGWIKEKLGVLTPWHVTRFYPQYRMNDLMPTPVATLEKAIKIGKQEGLKFIYAGNIPGHSSTDTMCYQCGRTVVQRQGYNAVVSGLCGSKCKYCGAELNFIVPAET